MGLASVAGPVETKVAAAASSGGVGGALATAAIYLLGTYAYHGSVPEPIQGAVYALVPALAAFGGGWLAKHTPRQDDFLRLAAQLADETAAQEPA